jgi:hypothetical protein
MNLEELIHAGFDESTKDEESEGYLNVKCSSCAALSINGTPCHETGCPNQRVECKECGCMLPKGERCDCLDPCFDDDEEDDS